MSFVYGVLNKKREISPANETKAAEPPGLGTYLDAVTALVPAEVLAINALLLTFLIDQEKKGSDPLTAITDVGATKLLFWLSILACVVFYVFGDRVQNAKEGAGTGLFENLNWLRALLPAAAYVAWTMLQKSTAFDAVAPDMSKYSRLVVAVIAAAILGVIAKRLGDKSDAV